jgi:hypothetical protein
MSEEELADLLARHLDTLFEDGALPADLPIEVADLLTVAQNLSEATPTPRPEFGPALKESLLGPTGGANGTTLPANSVFGGPIVISVIVIALLVGVAILALVVSFTVLGFVNTDQERATPIQTPIVPAPPTAFPVTPAPLSEPSSATVTPLPTTQPVPTVTPIVDVLPAITVTIEIIIEPPALVPGSGGGSDGDGNGGGGGDDGDHDRGHGNDSDGNDEDNPGKGDDD